MATATLLPQARFVAYDANGNPLAGGLVSTFVPGGTTPKLSWADAAETTPNANPIVLDSAGSCLLYGSGSYQLTVTDSLGNAIPAYSGLTSDAVTEAGISAAMVPVVGASTTAAALALLGGAPLIGSLPVFANVAALQAANSTNTPQTACIVLGYTTAGDGGGDVFYVGTAATSGNGGTIFNDSSQRSWYRDINGRPWQIEWFGGGVGVTDNTAAWNLLAAAIGSTVSIAFGPGVYSFASPITYTLPSYTAAVTISGAGPGVTTLTWPNVSGGLTITTIANPASNGSANDVQVSGMTLTTGVVNSGTALTLTVSGDQNSRPGFGINNISALEIRGSDAASDTFFWNTGIEISGVSQVNISDVVVNGNNQVAGGGTAFSVEGTATNIPVAINITACATWNCGTAVLFGNYTQGMTVSQCAFTGGSYGVVTEPNLTGLVEFVMSDTQIEVNSLAVSTNTYIADLILRNNLIYVPTGIAGTAQGIVLAQNQRTTIEGNHIISVGTSNGSGMNIGATTNDGGVISGNMLIGFTSGIGIALSSGSNGFNVQSNYYRDNGTNVSNSGTNNTIGGGSP